MFKKLFVFLLYSITLIRYIIAQIEKINSNFVWSVVYAEYNENETSIRVLVGA